MTFQKRTICNIPDDCMKCKYQGCEFPDGECPHVFAPREKELLELSEKISQMKVQCKICNSSHILSLKDVGKIEIFYENEYFKLIEESYVPIEQYKENLHEWWQKGFKEGRIVGKQEGLEGK